MKRKKYRNAHIAPVRKAVESKISQFSKWLKRVVLIGIGAVLLAVAESVVKDFGLYKQILSCRERAMIDRVRRSVVKLYVRRPDGSYVSASGFVARDGNRNYVYTDRHVVYDSLNARKLLPGVRCVDADGIEVHLRSAYVGMSESGDEMIDVVRYEAETDVPPLSLNDGKVQDGLPVFAFGHNDDCAFVECKTGIVISCDRCFARHNMQTEVGFSGGPIVNAAGEVVAIDAWEIESRSNKVNVAILLGEVRWKKYQQTDIENAAMFPMGGGASWRDVFGPVGLTSKPIYTKAGEASGKLILPRKVNLSALARLAESGDSKAMCELGMQYMYSQGVHKDESKAFKCFERAAELGNSEAKFFLSSCYAFGKGVSKDEKRANLLLVESAREGYYQALYNLAMLNNDGLRRVGSDMPIVKIKENLVKALTVAIEADVCLARTLLGECYTLGLGTKIDLKQAVKLYKESIEQGDRLAARRLGEMYAAGFGVDRNVEMAKDMFLKANDMWSRFELGVLYKTGEFGGESLERGDRMIEEVFYEALSMADREDFEAKKISLYCFGYLLPKGRDAERTIDHARDLAELGDCQAAMFLAYVYRLGYIGVIGEKESHYWDSLARRLILSAAASGDVMAKKTFLMYVPMCGDRAEKSDLKLCREFCKEMYEAGDLNAGLELGIMYMQGLGGCTNAQEGILILESIGKRGVVPALVELAYLYEEGIYVAKDSRKAFQILKDGARSGDASALNGLGDCYMAGLGCASNAVEAVKCYQMACDRNYLPAFCNLAKCYRVGNGCVTDKCGALKILRRAADLGWPDAQYSLGEIFEKGDGVKADLEEASTWYQKAMSGGLAEAEGAIRRVMELKAKKGKD